MGLLILAAIMLLAYLLSKRIWIAVETTGGTFIGLAFKPSGYGVSINSEAAESAIRLVEKAVMNTTSLRPQNNSVPQTKAPIPRQSSD